MKKRCGLWVMLLMLSCVMFMALSTRTYAAGLIPEDVDPDSTYYHERYDTSKHYLLDYQYASEGILGSLYSKVSGAEGIALILFAIVQVFWLFSMTVSRFATYLICTAYDFDLVERAVDKISAGLQKLLGVNINGFTSDGLMPKLLILTLLILGAYVVYSGMITREYTKAYGAVGNYIAIVLIAAVFAVNAGSYIQTVNDLSNEISGSILSIGTGLVTGESSNGEATDAIEEILFCIQIREPWLYLEFGETQEAAIGETRIADIEAHASSEESRSDAVTKDIEDNGNEMMTQNGLFFRFAGVLLFLVLNLVISFFVGFFAVLLILSQLLLLVYVFILPVMFIVGLIPGKHPVAYAGMRNAFKYMVIKVGISFILMITFSISVFLSEISQDKVLLFRLFLQLVCYIGVFLSLNTLVSILGMENSAILQRPRVRDLYYRYRSYRFMGAFSRHRRQGRRYGGLHNAPPGAEETPEDASAYTEQTQHKKRSSEGRSNEKTDQTRKDIQEMKTSEASKRKNNERTLELNEHERRRSEKRKTGQEHDQRRKDPGGTKKTPEIQEVSGRSENQRKRRRKTVVPDPTDKTGEKKVTSGKRQTSTEDRIKERPHTKYRKSEKEAFKNTPGPKKRDISRTPRTVQPEDEPRRRRRPSERYVDRDPKKRVKRVHRNVLERTKEPTLKQQKLRPGIVTKKTYRKLRKKGGTV